MTNKNECKLCGKHSELRERHIIPKFIFKWIKETGNQYLRNGVTPNIRVQDGIKELLFCSDCEQIFSNLEKWFAEHIFKPYLEQGQVVFFYQESLGKFIYSLLWRILLVSIRDEDFQNHPFYKELLEANEEWKTFLVHGKTPINYDEIHLVFVPDEWGAAQPNEYVSRYFTRVIDGHIITFENECWVFVKFARFMLFGKIVSSANHFRNSRINLTLGNTSLIQFIDNPVISAHLMTRAGGIYKHMKDHLSEVQLRKIESFAIKNIEKIAQSDLGKRLIQDYSAEISPNLLAPSFNYLCDCCNKPLSEPEGYMLRTFEIIRSEDYIKHIFKELQLGISDEHLQIRLEYFKQFVSPNSPWVVCEECCNYFDINKLESKKYLNEWIKAKGNYHPPKTSDFREHLTEDQLKQIGYWLVTV